MDWQSCASRLFQVQLVRRVSGRAGHVLSSILWTYWDGEVWTVDEELRVRQQDLDRLLDWMRRSGRPRSTADLVRFWLERLRDEAQRGR